MVVCPTGKHPYFLGSCFAFRDPGWFVTAAHCVGDLPTPELSINLPRARLQTTVQRVERHPTADVAVLHTRFVTLEQLEPFWGTVSNYALGEDFYAFGYPENVLSADDRQPTPRLFKGHFQRVFEHQSFMGYRYGAFELNIASPAGLSGGPLFRPGAHPMLTGMATENFESATQLHSVEEVLEGEQSRETRYQQIISYGVALRLDSVLSWLDEYVPDPPRDVEAIREAREGFERQAAN